MFTVAVTLLCVESALRTIVSISRTPETTGDESLPDISDFGSQIAAAAEQGEADVTDSSSTAKDSLSFLIAPSLICMPMIILNNVVWVRRRSFSAKWHTMHYFIASGLLVLLLPFVSWSRAMSDLKFTYTAMNILLL